jgi:hypothetical protein
MAPTATSGRLLARAIIGAVAAEVVCCECDRRSTGRASGWRGYLVDLDDDGRDEVVFFCPACAAREFGRPAGGRTEPADDGT